MECEQTSLKLIIVLDEPESMMINEITEFPNDNQIT